jgi:predicted outer membrane repeat protein
MRLRILVSFALLASIGAPGFSAARLSQLVRVPQDAKNLAVAIGKVADGGVIEMAAGTYPSPGKNGFTIGNARKGFTVRAAAGATVILDGGGKFPLLRFANKDRSRGKLVTFERITFQNGFSNTAGKAGGVTLSQAEALFRSCSFVNNRVAAAATGGGAAKVIDSSSATFINSSFRGNSSQLRAGAIAVRSAEAVIQGGDLTGNRTNLPGHNPNSFGGAIMVIDGVLRVTDVRFENNQAGWVGGAIYAIGNWNKGSDVQVTRSSFIANQAVADPCCDNPDSSTGGALHAEDLTSLKVQQSLFLRNRADVGGAVDGYRAVVEISGSVFQGNQTTLVKPAVGAGGAIAALSSDFSDASTSFGAINRRSAKLVISQSLLQGGSEVATEPHTGGCILAGGDGSRMFGGGGVPVAGTHADNRARIELRGVVFSDCDAESAGGGIGGALAGDLIDLVMEDSMVLDSDARGTNASGGGIALRQESSAQIVRTTFAKDSAQRMGGALFLSGSTVQVDDSRFYSNDVAPGDESLTDSRGAAIFAIPHPTRPTSVAGVIANSVFSESSGLPIRDADPQSGPINDLRYDGNRFNPVRFGDLVYVNTLVAANGLNVEQLNTLVVNRGARGSTDKSLVANTRIFGPREGSLRVVPAPNSVGASAPAPTSSLLAYAWSGGAANIGTSALPGKAGLLEVAPGQYALTVDGTVVATVTAPIVSAARLRLNGSRFTVDLSWRDSDGNTGAGRAVPLSGDTGYFSLSSMDKADVIVRVLDARRVNGHFWVYFSAQTDVELTLTVTDTRTGKSKTYFTPLGTRASQRDTEAIPGD